MSNESRPGGSSLTTKSVGEMASAKMKFFIPSYQRGYRWAKEQVTALLSDLKEYEDGPRDGHFYCLQPLVVTPRGDEWEVVDGQQRLTTIFLILRQFSPNQPRFQLKYERHSDDLEHLTKDDDSAASPDLHFINEAETAIQEWRTANKGLQLKSLMDVEGLSIRFIWHRVDPKEAIRSFSRLNGGKIKLTDAELIRAALVRTTGQNEADRQRIALRWDYMERRLQETEFWAFLNKQSELPECRMEWLLRLAAPMAKSAKDAADHAVFEWFFERLKTRSPAQLWEEVEALFGTLEEWFEDNRLFHLVGCLVYLGTEIRSLVTATRQHRKDVFRIYLKSEIRKKIFDGLLSNDNIATRLSELSYHDEKGQPVRHVLLVFNLAALEADQTGTIRFSFDAFREQDWDIEHIHASASRLPESKLEYKAAFEALRDHFYRLSRNDDVAKIDVLLAELCKAEGDDLKRFHTSYAELIKEFQHGLDDGQQTLTKDEIDQLWNLTLLDATTNRGYGNNPFAIKRGWILGLDQSERYILPCTRNVFTKAYSREPVNLLHWSRADANDYLQSITDRLGAFFNESWSGTQSVKVPSQVNKASPTPSGEVRVTALSSTLSPQSARVSFLGLFESFHCSQVEIPLLQRDYAHGRASAELVRTSFLHELRDSLTDGGSLNLDFIYGEVHDRRFQPIDGQQRLTTLFLLHWYLAGVADQMNDFRERMRDATGEPRFRYSVRQSSQRFFNALLDIFAMPSSEITLQPWFLKTWKHDPTIAGALTVIDAIAETFKDPRYSSGSYEKLLTRSPITFDALDLGSIGQSEDIYLKMNARGVELTGFEKFKAHLEEAIQMLLPGDVPLPNGQSGSFKTYFSVQMDGDWLDLFWQYAVKEAQQKAAKIKVPDAMIMRLVREVAILSLALDAPKGWKEQLQTLRGTPKLHELEKAAFRNQTFAQTFAVVLERWSGGGDSIQKHLLPECPFKEDELFKKVIQNDDALSYSESVMLYAYAAYLDTRRGADLDQASFSEWMRVVFNLVENSRNDATTFKKRLEGIRDLLAKADGILNYLVGNDTTLVEDFDAYQVEEERLKAGLLLRNLELWRKPILDAEAHGYFRGQIGFLFRFAGIETAGVEADALLPLFEVWWKKAAHCFSNQGIIENADFRWERALLATGDYLLDKGTHLLGNNRSEDFNWKRLLRGREDETRQSGHLKQLIDGIRCECPLPDQLEAIIKDALERFDLEEWRRLMIQWPETIGFCKENRISREGGTVYLLQRSDYRGRWAEIWSFALHLELKKRIGELGPFHEAGYHTARGENSCAWVVWKSQPYGDVALSIEREGEGAKLTVLRWQKEPLDSEMVKCIEASDFRPAEREHGRYERSLNERGEAKGRVQEMAAVLRRFLEINHQQ